MSHDELIQKLSALSDECRDAKQLHAAMILRAIAGTICDGSIDDLCILVGEFIAARLNILTDQARKN